MRQPREHMGAYDDPDENQEMEPRRYIISEPVSTLAARITRVKDRLIAGGLPALGLATILWAIGNTYPAVASETTVATNVLLILISLIALSRLTEVAYAHAYAAFSGPVQFCPLMMFLATVFFMLALSGNTIQMTAQIGLVSSARLSLMSILICMLFVFYREARDRQMRVQRQRTAR